METLHEMVARVAANWHVAAFGFALFTALELALPRERQALSTRFAGLVFWMLWFPVSIAVDTGFDRLWSALGLQPLFRLGDGGGHWLTVTGVVIASACIYDFFFYWCHRAQHRFLWRFHAVHHSIRDLNTVNAFHHVTEPVIQSVLIILPMSLLVADGGRMPIVVTFLMAGQAWLIHSSARLHLGPFARLFVDNRFHRIHHSVEERHFDRNFGAFTTLWDHAFGTAWRPAADEWPETGIAELDQPRTIGAWLSFPWRYRRAVTASQPDRAEPNPGYI